MKSLRYLLSIIVLALLAGGYFASQYYYFDGRPQEWAAKVDTPAVAWLALLMLLGAIVLSFVPERETNDR